MELDHTASSEPEIDAYQVLASLSSGGMGKVFLARRHGAHGFEKLVALKTILPDLREADEVRAMFLDEARLMARFDHPALTHVLDFGEQGTTLYLVMEYVAGVSLSAVAKRKPPPHVAAQAMLQVCRGLHAAHELRDAGGTPLGVVHRDVSPQNVMLTFDGHIKIFDFGIALMRGRRTPVTEYGQVKGKPAYMAPEQLKGEPIDRRTDVFAAGIVLHELLTGRRLFTGDSVYAVALAIDQQKICAPSSIASQVSTQLDAVVLRALQKNPRQRFASARHMADALLRVVQDSTGETLEQYASQVFASERAEHEDWLRQVLEVDQVTPRRRGRADDVDTLPRGAQQGCAETLTETDLGDLSVSQVTVPMSPPVQSLKPRGAKGDAAAGNHGFWGGRSLWGLLLVAIAGGVALTWWRLVPPPETAHGAAVESGVGGLQESNAVVRPAAGADAAVAAEHDAAASVDQAAHVEKRRAVTTERVPRAKKRDPSSAGATSSDKTPTQTFAYLSVAAEPYALVMVDGEQIGTTPIYNYKLASGTHSVVLVSPDSGEIRHREELQLGAGERRRIVVRSK